MGGGLSRTVEIEIHNKTTDITLTDPKTFLWSGHNTGAPSSEVRPGRSESCSFSNSTIFWGCNGVLAYEGETFTLALYFSNPVDYNRFSQEVGLELSKDKICEVKLRNTYTRLVGGRHTSSSCASHRVTPERAPEPIKVSTDLVKVTATMFGRRNATIRVVVEDQEVPRKGSRREKVEEDQEGPWKGGKKEKDWDDPWKGGKKEKDWDDPWKGMVEDDWEFSRKGSKKEKDWEGSWKGDKKEKEVEDDWEFSRKGSKKEKDWEGPWKWGRKEKEVEKDLEGPRKRGKKKTRWAVKEAHLV